MNLKDPQTQKVVLGVILAAGLGYAFYQYVYTPKAAELAELEAQAERLEKYNENAKVAAQANRITALEQESVSYVRRLEAFEDLIPTSEQVPQLLERIATSALEADVDFLSFTPLPAEPGTFYTEQFYELEVRGGYHAIGTFLTRIANLPRIIKPTVTELIGERVQPPVRVQRTGAAARPPETLVRAKLRLSTYVVPGGEATVVGRGALGSPDAAPPGAAQGPAPVAPVAPPTQELGTKVSPEVARALEAARARAAAKPGAPPAAGGAAAPAEAGQVAPPAAPSTDAPAGAAAPPPAPATAQPAPAQPALAQPAPADLPPPGERPTRTDDRSRPGALPPLGAERGANP